MDSILQAIDKEISRLQEIRKVLVKEQTSPGRDRSGKSSPKTKKAKKRVLSPDARARIASAQKKRWAAAKKRSK